MAAEPTLLPLGRIVRLQIQRSRLKLGEKPNRVYDPAPILAVDELILTRDGALARLPDGGTLVDVHHAAHPETQVRDRLHLVVPGGRPAAHSVFRNSISASLSASASRVPK